MEKQLLEVTLKTDEPMAISRIEGPDKAWTERLAPFLGHKGSIWNWQNRQALGGNIDPLDARYYVGLVHGEVAGNICIFTYRGTGILGHVFTAPDHRRKGICAAVIKTLLDDFTAGGGKALVLGTGYDSPAWHIYKSVGFNPVYPESGMMDWFADDIDTFESSWFAAGASTIRPLDWRDWPGLAALMCQRRGSYLRIVVLNVYNRYNTEYSYLPVLKRIKDGGAVPSAALESDTTGATVGFAALLPDKRFPGTSIAELFVHPNYEEKTTELLDSLKLDNHTGKIQAYAETADTNKIAALTKAGFEQEAVLKGQITLDSGIADVAVFRR